MQYVGLGKVHQRARSSDSRVPRRSGAARPFLRQRVAVQRGESGPGSHRSAVPRHLCGALSVGHRLGPIGEERQRITRSAAEGIRRTFFR